MVEKNTGFAARQGKGSETGACDRKIPCEKELSPIGMKIREADQVAMLAGEKTETLQNRIRESKKTDCLEKQLATEEDLAEERQRRAGLSGGR